jgi:hypothetical protein
MHIPQRNSNRIRQCRFETPFSLALLIVSTGISVATAVQDKGAVIEAGSGATVECRVPSQIRALGKSANQLAPRRQIRVSIEECRKRGGQVVEPKKSQSAYEGVKQ